MMQRVIVYCEGQTEEKFVKHILAKRYNDDKLNLTAHCFNGVSKYRNISKDLTKICKNDSSAIITTMIDYYGMPKDTPGIDCDETDIYRRIKKIEEAIRMDIAADNFLPFIMIHEFEAMLFSDIEAFKEIGCSRAQIEALKDIGNKYLNPEYINNGVNTAPSKRILKIYPSYQKPIDGITVLNNIGIEKIKEECPHFCQWIDKILSLKTNQYKIGRLTL